MLRRSPRFKKQTAGEGTSPNTSPPQTPPPGPQPQSSPTEEETEEDPEEKMNFDKSYELHREANLRTGKDLQEAHFNLNNNVAVVTALLGGFGLSFATQELHIGKHASANNVWADDELGKEWWTFSVVLMALMTLVTCFTAINNAQQIAQCPERLFRKWFGSVSLRLFATFTLLTICYILFIIAFTLTCSLILRKWMFIVAVVTFDGVFIIVGWFMMIGLARTRLDLIWELNHPANRRVCNAALTSPPDPTFRPLAAPSTLFNTRCYIDSEARSRRKA